MRCYLPPQNAQQINPQPLYGLCPLKGISSMLHFWCERGDSNPHGYPLDPKSSASASSATLARGRV
jgi:hypothetical protein